MFHELRYTVRALKNDPSFAAIAVLFPRVTGPEVVDVRSGYYGGEMGVQMGDHAEFAGTYLVTPNFFPVFGVAPTFGRAFETNDAQRAAIVSLPFAARNFGSGAAALGQTLHVERVGYLQAGRLFENARRAGCRDSGVARSPRRPGGGAAQRVVDE